MFKKAEELISTLPPLFLRCAFSGEEEDSHAEVSVLAWTRLDTFIHHIVEVNCCHILPGLNT